MDPSVQPVVQTCYRHPDSPAGVVCQRCDRPICPKCMHQASVGFHCPECVKSGKQKVVTGPGVFLVKPILTQVLIGLNVLVFLIGAARDGAGSATGDSSGRFATSFALIAKAWQRGNDFFIADVPGSHKVGVAGGEWYRLISSGFMHYGLIHLLLNMYALWILGQAVEQMAGRLRFGLIYGVSLLAGALGALLLSPGDLTAGASGAIFGLMGAIFIAHRAAGIPFRNSPLLPVLVLNLVFTFGVSNISIGGHLGGLAGGAASGWLLLDFARRRGVDKGLVYGLVGGLALVVVVASYMVASAYTPT